jgi:hypothetical protein
VHEHASCVQIDAGIKLVRLVVVRHGWPPCEVTGRPDPASWLPAHTRWLKLPRLGPGAIPRSCFTWRQAPTRLPRGHKKYPGAAPDGPAGRFFETAPKVNPISRTSILSRVARIVNSNLCSRRQSNSFGTSK